VPILDELARKLQAKSRWDTPRVTVAVRHVAEVATVIKPTDRLTILADEPDNRILECAVAAGADAIVTDDRHPLVLERYKGVEIITLTSFLEWTA
jgi:predicted nucleic acid-binding protein